MSAAQFPIFFFPVLLLRWFCHVDDDNYVNPEALLSLLSAFPEEGDVYVGKPSLDKPITAQELLEGNATVAHHTDHLTQAVPELCNAQTEVMMWNEHTSGLDVSSSVNNHYNTV